MKKREERKRKRKVIKNRLLISFVKIISITAVKVQVSKSHYLATENHYCKFIM